MWNMLFGSRRTAAYPTTKKSLAARRVEHSFPSRTHLRQHSVLISEVSLTYNHRKRTKQKRSRSTTDPNTTTRPKLRNGGSPITSPPQSDTLLIDTNLDPVYTLEGRASDICICTVADVTIQIHYSTNVRTKSMTLQEILSYEQKLHLREASGDR